MKMIRPHHILLAGALLVSVSACRAQQTVAPNPLMPMPAQAVGTTPEISAARAALLAGVTDVTAPGLPGVVSAFGPRAFPVILGKAGGGKNATVAPAVAAAFTPKGRVVVFGHDGFFGKEAWEVGQTGQLLLNSVRWTQNGQTGKIGVLLGDDNAAMVEHLKTKGIDAAPIGNGAALTGYSTLIVNGHRLTKADEAPLKQFVANGGGLVMATTGWGWNWGNESQTLSKDYFGNQLLAPYGLVWSEGTIEGSKKNGATVFSVGEILPLANAGRALDLLEASIKNPQAMTGDDAKLASRSLSDLLTGLPESDLAMQNRFHALLTTGGDLQFPTDKAPLGPNEPGARLRYLLALRQEQSLPVAQIKADPAAATFPGAVPTDAKTVTKTVAVDLAIPQWHSTGLYAAAGTKVSVTIPGDLTGKKLSVRIGSHTDSLVNLDSWKRSPEVSRTFPLSSATTEVGNPFGGLVYVVVPEGLTGQINVTISGAVEAPLFELGKTSVADWKTTIRNAPGPWAELASDRVIVTVPSANVRDIEDPTTTLELYNRAFMAMADLRGLKTGRLHTYPERIVSDEQISAGYMHSGYPVMTWLDVQKKSVDYDLLMKESWGHWHEFGHNHQVGAWTPEGTGEVTNNLFALYVWENVIGKADNDAHPALKPADFQKQWTKYDEGGRKFDDWKSNPFLALHSYIQLKNSFGWEPFKTVFREYENMPEAQRPQTDQDKRDQWMIRFSRAVGRNLAPFYTAWGVPISEKAAASVKDLPIWMPTTEQTLGIQTNLAAAPQLVAKTQ
ncbi:hypothetical protein IAD21_04556 [Abditibacteriota bacterium]|nr:hypothetical protein IAD21_04556 [Abditibacteriota bacterium]